MPNMTFEQYIINPMGKNNSVLNSTAREAMRNVYTNKFHNVLLKENGKIDYFLYKDTKHNIYYAHIKVPSEVIKDFYYDTIIKFFADETVKESALNLEKYYVQFFSNDPAFVFTYTHAFVENGLFIKELSSKMSQEALKKKAVEKNPNNDNGYVKSIYFAYLFLKERGLLKKVRWGEAQEFNLKLLLSNITHADEKILARQEEEEKRDKRKKVVVDKNIARTIKKYGVSDTAKDRLVTTTSKVQTVKRTSASNNIKKTKTTKVTKRKK